MLSVYVVDDEIMAIEYFKMLLQGCKIPCILVGFAINSWSALDDIMEHRPDVIFIDINMPGMSGIELAEVLLEKMPDIKIIFLTAYRDFDFVKKGLEMGVVSYVLKNELNSDTLETELENISELLQKEREIQYLKTDKALRRFFLGTDISELEQAELKKNQMLQMFYITSRRSYSMQRMQDLEWEIDYDDFVKTQEKNGNQLCAFPHIKSNVWTPVFYVEREEKKEKLKRDVEEYLSRLDFEYMWVELPPASGFFQLREQFQSARRLDEKRLDFGDCQQVTIKELEELPTEKKHLGIYEEKLKNALHSHARSVEHETLMEALDVYTRYTNDARFIKYAQLIFNDYCLQMISARFIAAVPQEWDYKEFSSKEEWKQWMLGLITQYYQMRGKSQRRGYSEKITKVLNLIEQNYMDNTLSSQQIADQLKISDGHLRKMFREEMGVTLSDYVLQFRIDKARRLLMEESTKISEIYEELGFSSSQYFSTVFKKKTGFSPKEYTQKYRVEKEYEEGRNDKGSYIVS